MHDLFVRQDMYLWSTYVRQTTGEFHVVCCLL